MRDGKSTDLHFVILYTEKCEIHVILVPSCSHATQSLDTSSSDALIVRRRNRHYPSPGKKKAKETNTMNFCHRTSNKNTDSISRKRET
jgi:hypothetical protein